MSSVNNKFIYVKDETLPILEAIFFKKGDMAKWVLVIYELEVVRGFHRNTKGEWSKVWTIEDQLNLIEKDHHIYDDPIFCLMVWHF